ncbi:MAG: fumarylacetoacetate hydrolase, partial [Burkholderiales bacterium]|nr:fumarylacetoacetate hydrolase [Burkholderiales bacterium]
MPRKQTLIALATLAIGVAAATSAHAACLSDVQVAEMAEHYAARTPAANPEGLSDADGACTR